MKSFSPSPTVFHPGSRRAGLLVALVSSLSLTAPSLPGAQPLSPALAASIATRKAAFLDFRNGDASAGLLKLNSLIRRDARAPHEDFQLGSMLVDVCCTLRNEGHASRIRGVANLALEKLSNPSGRMSPRDAAAAYSLVGSLHDYVLNDAASARAAYQQVAALAPNNRQAQERLTHLKAIEDNALAKAAANQELRQRELQPKR